MKKKTRIIKVTIGQQNHPGVHQSYYVAQYQAWWLPFVWRDIKWFYQSEIDDMPGYWTNVNENYQSASDLIERFKRGDLCLTKSETYMSR